MPNFARNALRAIVASRGSSRVVDLLFRGLIAFSGVVACLLLSSCGGGGGAAGSTQPSGATTTTATARIAPTGGSVSIGTQVAATVAPNTLAVQGRVTVTLAPKADAGALAASDLILSLPADQLTAAADAGVTVYVYPDQLTVQANGRERAMGLPAGLDLTKLFAKVTVVGAQGVQYSTAVVWDVEKAAYAVGLKTLQLSTAALLWTGQAIDKSLVQPKVDFLINIWLAENVDYSNTPRHLYAWPKSGVASEPSPPIDATDTDKTVPLILVHGIKGIGITPVCGTNDYYKKTWSNFAQSFYDDADLPLKYTLYTFQYPTNQGIKANGHRLAEEISKTFGTRPVVVVSHSMGGLVTRAADLLFSEPGVFNVDIRNVITLDTPHRGVPIADDVAGFIQDLCPGADSDQGAKDLGWEFNADGSCANALLCDQTSGLNAAKNLEHLKKYVPYSGSFDIPCVVPASSNLSSSFAQLIQTTCQLAGNVLQAPSFIKHPVYFIPRWFQLRSQAALAPAARSDGDGVTLVMSQRLQRWGGSSWVDQSELFRLSRLRTVFPDTDHGSIHDDGTIFKSAIRPDLLDFYLEIAGAPTISTHPQNASVIVGQSATFTVAATGNVSSYEWRKGNAVSSVPAPGAANSSTYTTPSTTLADNGGTYFVIVHSQASATTSNVATLTVTAPSGSSADLAVSNIAFVPTTSVPGGTIGVQWTISNNGNAVALASTTVVRITNSASSSAGPNLATVSAPALLVGASNAGPAVLVTAPTSPGTYYLWVIADNFSTSGQSASAAANDIVRATGTLTVTDPGTVSPDLVVQNISLTPGAVAPSGNVQVNWTLTNQGNATAAASNAVVRINQSTTSAAGTNLATVSTPALIAGASIFANAAIVPAPATPGTYRVWVIADNNSTSGQSAAAAVNDIVLATGTLTVTDPGTVSPDLVVQNISFTPGTVVPGGSVQVNWTLTNQGNATAAASNAVVRVNQSTSSSAGANLASVSTASLIAGSTIFANAAVVTAPTTPGTYQVWVLADASGTAGQSAAASGNDALVAIGTLTVGSSPAGAAPGGLYVGYYAEDPVSNPEDPTTGALYLQLPAGNSTFSGSMYFTFAGCQSINVGAISGTKTDTAMSGAWSGTVDGSAQAGAYSGSFNASGAYFGGTYTVAGGKQLRNVPGCIQYYIAPNGSWEVAPVGTSVPSTFALNVSGTRVTWASPSGTALTLTSVIDEALAAGGAPSAAKYQTLSGASVQLFDLSGVPGLTVGQTYVVTVAAVSGGGQRTGFASVRVIR